LQIRIRTDTHYFGKLDTNGIRTREKLDPDQYLSKIQELESLKMDVDAHNGGAEAQNGALKGL
jgi:hypothetical protein